MMYGMDKLGLTLNISKVKIYRNLSYKEISEHEKKYNEGKFIKNNTFAVDTGKFTGRSPKDKWIVRQHPSQDHIWWGDINQPLEPSVFDILYNISINHFNTKVERLYLFDGFCGVNKTSQMKVRIITELAWQHHFVTNMFIRPELNYLKSKESEEPEFTIINACNVIDTDWKQHGLHSEVFIAFNIEKRIAVIGGTFYGGEMKKGIFSMMNYYLPLNNIMTMHASANKGKEKGDTAIFFGLSGTGKTTLSADPKRLLIGDDEHGWDNEGIFNFEGGCYAKTINLSKETEPDIFHAIIPNAMLENVYIDQTTNEPDFFNTTKTENGRVSYPIYHIPNYEKTSMGTHPHCVIFLTCDAYGVLPPISKLNNGQAQYHFLSGYTAKVAGTERGIIEPEATFSACFGAAFMTLHPTKYADLLKKKLEEHSTNVYLVNTGWTGGKYGSGKRISLSYTRKCIDAILDQTIEKTRFRKDPFFGFQVPIELHDIPKNLLDPKVSWINKEDYDTTAMNLANMFKNNFKQYVISGHTDYSSNGPTV